MVTPLRSWVDFMKMVMKEALLALISVVTQGVSAAKTFGQWWRKRAHTIRLLQSFPCPAKPLPVIGNLCDIGLFPEVSAFMDYLTNTSFKLPVFVFWVGPYPTVCLRDPRDIEVVFSKSRNPDKPFFYSYMTMITGNGLIPLSGETHRKHQKIILPAFSNSVLESFIPIYCRQTDIFLEKLNEKADGSIFDVSKAIQYLAFDIISETVMGVSSTTQLSGFSDFVDFYLTSLKTFPQRLKQFWLHPDFIFKISSLGRKVTHHGNLVKNAVNKVIQTRKKKIQKCEAESRQSTMEKNKGLIFLDRLLEAHWENSITNTEVIDEVTMFTATGFDTITVFLQMAIYELARKPNIQENVVQELEKIFGTVDIIEPTADTISQMTYLDMVVKENLRLNPPVWLFGRVAATDIQLVSCDLTIPAGTTVLSSILNAQRDAQYFPNPNTFDPDRFLPENSKYHAFSFLPFGAGSRTCTGKRMAITELKCILAKILWRFRILPDPSYKPELYWCISTAILNGTRIKLERRGR